MDLKGKKVLITGGLGFIGSNLAHRLLSLGSDVSIYDCMDPCSGGNLYNIHDIKNDVELTFNDIEHFESLSNAICGKDLVFNCAARTSHPASMQDPLTNIDVNCTGVINLLEAIRRFEPDCRIVHIGTSTQLGRLQYRPADENHPEYPTDIYSANKSVSEKYTMIYATGHGLHANVVRLSNVYGPRACINSAEFTFNNYFIGLALSGKDITVFGSGDQKRNLIYVDDAVDALIKVGSNNISGETFFAVGDEHYSVKEIAYNTVKHIGSGNVVEVQWPNERKAIEIGDAILSNNKIKQEIGWSPSTILEEGLKKTFDYFSGCLDKYL